MTRFKMSLFIHNFSESLEDTWKSILCEGGRTILASRVWTMSCWAVGSTSGLDSLCELERAILPLVTWGVHTSSPVTFLPAVGLWGRASPLWQAQTCLVCEIPSVVPSSPTPHQESGDSVEGCEPCPHRPLTTIPQNAWGSFKTK